jgi:hypothetical protein
VEVREPIRRAATIINVTAAIAINTNQFNNGHMRTVARAQVRTHARTRAHTHARAATNDRCRYRDHRHHRQPQKSEQHWQLQLQRHAPKKPSTSFLTLSNNSLKNT